MPTANTHTPSSTPATAVAVRTWPYPTGTSTSGNQKSHWAISPATYVVRDAGSGGRYTGRNSAHPLAERPDRIRPIDPLGDHRRRHPRIRRQQLPNPRFDLIDHRPGRRTLILRRPIRGQRRLHRVPRNPQHPRDLRNRQPLRPTQPPDLRPVLHAQHSLPPWPIAKVLQEAGQFSVAAQWSVFSCRRQTGVNVCECGCGGEIEGHSCHDKRIRRGIIRIRAEQADRVDRGCQPALSVRDPCRHQSPHRSA